jgi:hypothetical protein
MKDLIRLNRPAITISLVSIRYRSHTQCLRFQPVTGRMAPKCA